MDQASLSEHWSLFHWAIAAALAAGLAAPLTGVFLFVRRTSFYGIALPQFATAGVVCGFTLLPWWVEHVGLGGLSAESALLDSHAAQNYHLAWATTFVLAGASWLVWAGRRRAGSETARVAAAFACATAATFLLGRISTTGRGFVDLLIQGELLGVDLHAFETLGVVLALATGALLWFQRDLVLVSFDPDAARVLGKRATVLEALLVVIVAMVVSVGTMFLGPTLLFGLLVLPPLAAHAWAGSMRSFFWLASLFGVLSVVLGMTAAFYFDLPIGPAIVAAAGLCAVPGGLRARR